MSGATPLRPPAADDAAVMVDVLATPELHDVVGGNPSGVILFAAQGLIRLPGGYDGEAPQPDTPEMSERNAMEPWHPLQGQ